MSARDNINATCDNIGFNNGSLHAVRGYSFPKSLPCKKSGWKDCNMKTIADWRSCCHACVGSGCVTWTYHPENGCWLHGNFTNALPVSVACGDGNQCITGPNVGMGRPLPPPTPPGPP